MADLAFSDVVTSYTRATPGWVFNGDGKVEKIATGNPRFSHDPTTRDTSSTELTIETDTTKTVTVSGAVTFKVGWFVRISNTADLTEWMAGEVTSVSGNDVTVAVDQSNGTGTISSWVVIHSLGLLVEAQRTNSLLDNRDLSTANWTTSATINQNATGLDGVANKAWTAEDDSASTNEEVQQSITVSANTNTHVSLFFIKKDSDETRFPEFTFVVPGVAGESATFNTKTGSVTARRQSSGTTQVKDAGDWWRIVQTITNDGTGTSLSIKFSPAFNTDGTSTVDTSATGSIIYDFGGVRLNASTFGSPIETGSSTVTVNADDASMTLPSELQSGGAWVVHARTATGGGTQVLGQIDDTTENNRCRLVRNSSDEIHFIVTDGGGEVANLNLGTVADDTDFKVAVRYQTDDYAGSLDGAAVVTDTAGTLPSLTTKRPGRDTAGDEWNSTIALDKMYANPGDWSDADLQEASS